MYSSFGRSISTNTGASSRLSGTTYATSLRSSSDSTLSLHEDDALLSVKAKGVDPANDSQSRLRYCLRWLPSKVSTHSPEIWISVFKCALAYLVATLFTFIPVLSRFVARLGTHVAPGEPIVSSRAGHMAATVYVTPV